MDSSLLQAVLIGVFVVLLSHWLWQRRNVYKFAAQLPGTMWGLPVLGCIFSIGRIDYLLTFLQHKWKTINERTFCAFMTITPMVFTKDPQVIKQLLTEPAFDEKARIFYKPVQDSLGGGMLVLRAEKALRHRKMLAPAFRPKQLLNFMPVFNQQGLEFAQHLNRLYEASGTADNLLNELRLYAINMTRMTTMGCPSATYEFGDELSAIHDRLAFAFKHVFWEIILACANCRWLIQYNPVYRYKIQKLYSVGKKIISYRASTMHSEGMDMQSENVLVIDQGYKHFQRGGIKWHEVIGEMNGVLVASYETTASTLYSVLFLLAMHPDIQERVHEEIESLFPTKGVHVAQEHLSQLNYMEMVINEALRLFPPAPLIAREAKCDTTIQIANKSYEMPKNMQVVIDIMGLHRDADIWGANADRFDPDHFLPHNVANRDAYAFIPFSKGARICFGWSYAYMVMKVTLVHILRSFKLTTPFKYEQVQPELKLFLIFLKEPLLHLQRRT